MSFVHQSEEQFGFGHDFVVDDAFARSLAETLLDAQHFAMDEKGIAGKDRFPEFNAVGTHEVTDFSGILGLMHHHDACDLGHGFHLENPGHHGMPREVSLKIGFVDCDGLHARLP